MTLGPNERKEIDMNVPKLKLDQADVKGFALKSSIALYEHTDEFVRQAYPKHRGNMPQPVAVSGPVILSDRNPEAVKERYLRLKGHDMLMNVSRGKAFYRQKDDVSKFGEVFLMLPEPLRQIHQIRDRKDKSMPPSGYTYSRIQKNNEVPEPYDCSIDVVRPRTVGWSPGNKRSLEPMPSEYEHLATVISTNIRPSTHNGSIAHNEHVANSISSSNFSLGPNDETGKEGGLTRVAIAKSRAEAAFTSPVDSCLMHASQSSRSRLSTAEKSLKSRLDSAHTRPGTIRSTTKRYDALGVGKVWEASQRLKRKLRLQRQKEHSWQQKLNMERVRECKECFADLEKFDRNMKGGRKRFEGWP